METNEEISLDELSTRCGCCFRSFENAINQQITKDIEAKFEELVQYEFIARNFATSICSECDQKLSEFASFKKQLLQNQKNLQNSLSTYIKIEPDTIRPDFIEEYLDPEFDDDQNRQTCQICSQSISIGALDTHMKRKHSNVFSFYCDQCPKKFKIKRDLVSHLAKHTEVELRRMFQCEYCAKSYTKKSSLQHHIRMRHVEAKEKFVCECGASFKTQLRLNYHKKMTHVRGEFLCEKCDKVYPSMHNLKIHISHFHGEKSPCVFCGKLIAPGSFMKRHMRTHETPSHVCDICKKAFTIRETMLEHRRTVHQMGEPHYCENCGKSFGSRKVLRRHIARSHKTYEKAQCLIVGCSYAASRKDNLINHVKTHKDVIESEKTEIVKCIKAMRNLSW